MNFDGSITAVLFANSDKAYRDFQCRLMPTVNRETVIGVRTPFLRSFAHKISGSAEAEEFLSVLPHTYYEENNLHAFLIEQIKDYAACISALDAFLPYVDNWATCDMMRPKVFAKHLPELITDIRRWLASGQTYTVRFGLEMLMSFYLDTQFRKEYLDYAASVCSEEYYVRMMQAWFFATALAKQFDASIEYIETERLDAWTHNKAIRKSIESYRITDLQKERLRALKKV